MTATSTRVPDLALVSAQATDSRGVAVEYDILGADIAHSFNIGLFRSADSRFGTEDRAAGSVRIVAPGEGEITRDDQGNPATAQGHHRLTLPLPGGLPPDPGHPYVLTVADPEGAIVETTTADNTASFRKHVVAVVTHGGKQPGSWARGGPPWLRRMAASLRADGYEAVVAYNWVAQSSHAGSARRQAPKLAARVRDAVGQFPADEPVDVHFIGHSEGAVINSQAILALNSAMPPQMKAGYLKLTMLDPHAASTNVTGQQYSVSGGLLGWIAKLSIDRYQSKAKDPAVVVPPNVNDAEVFYQHTPVGRTHTSNHGLYNLWGQVPVRGPAHYFNLTGRGISHSGTFGVQDWYQRNVVPTLGDGPGWVASKTITGGPVSGPGAAGTRPDDDRQPTFAGTAAPGATVRLLAKPAGTAQFHRVGGTIAGPDGSWGLTTRPFADGRYRLFATSELPEIPGQHRPHMLPTLPLGQLTVAAARGPRG
jgi:hypothetical protein